MTMRHRAASVLFVLALSACAPAAPAPMPAVPVGAAQFARWRWLEGRWLGGGDTPAPFAEAYRVLDDSTIRSYAFAAPGDSVPSDSGTIRLRGGTVASGDGAMRWEVVAFGADSLVFAPRGTAANGFTWRRTSDTTWTAALWQGTPSDPAPRRYRMVRVP